MYLLYYTFTIIKLVLDVLTLIYLHNKTMYLMYLPCYVDNDNQLSHQLLEHIGQVNRSMLILSVITNPLLIPMLYSDLTYLTYLQ